MTRCLALLVLLAAPPCPGAAPTPTGSPTAPVTAPVESEPGEPGVCAPVAELLCGERIDADTADWNSGATDVLDGYPVAAGNFDGPELVYSFVAPNDGSVSFALRDARPLAVDHDLLLLDGSVPCGPEAALARGFNDLQFEAEAGERYLLVVDGFAGAAGPVAAELTCVSAPSSADGDPTAPLPDLDEGLVNTSHDLLEVLEFGDLLGACERWSGDPADRRDMLLCGKSMFFYEGFGGMGVPTAIFDFLSTRFPDSIGRSFENYGLVPDPYSPRDRPLGFPEGAPFGGQPTVAFGCAQCHFGQMPDGRYAVGYPNLQYEYGKLSLALFLAPLKANPMFEPSAQDPAALEAVGDVLADLDDPWLRGQLLWSLMPLVGALSDAPALTPEVQAQYASWDAGVLDAVLAPAPVDDGVATPTRILDLWSVPQPDELASFGMDSPLLGWNGDAPDLHVFLEVFIRVSDGPVAEWTPDRLTPLVEYLRTLREPENPQPAQPSLRGEQVFAEDCAACHDGPRRQSRDIFEYAEIGTDDAYRRWGDPDLTGVACCGLDEGGDGMRHGLKAPRLTALWAKDKLLHNGSVHGLDELLCLSPRRGGLPQGFGSQGHTFGCDRSEADREALKQHLLSR